MSQLDATAVHPVTSVFFSAHFQMLRSMFFCQAVDVYLEILSALSRGNSEVLNLPSSLTEIWCESEESSLRDHFYEKVRKLRINV
jgi:hypothetical protein